MTPTRSSTAPDPAPPAPVNPSRLKTGLLALLFAVQTVTIVGVLASERFHAEQAMRSIAEP